MNHDTIFSISTPKIPSPLSIFRISGPNCLQIIDYFKIDKIQNNQDKYYFLPRKTYLVKLFLPCNTLLDECILIYFEEKKSFTGEKVIELHTHGSLFIQSTLNIHLNKLFRQAKAGEFTQQAVKNKKMNLIQAEALHDIISSNTLIQHKQATAQMQGILFRRCNDWSDKILKILTLIEGHINFGEEIDDSHIINQIEKQINEIKQVLSQTLNNSEKGILINNGIKVGIFGNPNAGKSSLMNAITNLESSIVTNIPGTTTDVIHQNIKIKEYPIILYDTAGVRSKTANEIEAIGIKKSLKLIKDMFIKIIMIDLSTKDINNDLLNSIDKNTIIILNKSDISNTTLNLQEFDKAFAKHTVSVKNHNDISIIINSISEILEKSIPKEEPAYITQERHKNELLNALDLLEKINALDDLAITSHQLQLAVKTLNSLVNEVDSEEILDSIFRTFCIGK